MPTIDGKYWPTVDETNQALSKYVGSHSMTACERMLVAAAECHIAWSEASTRQRARIAQHLQHQKELDREGSEKGGE